MNKKISKFWVVFIIIILAISIVGLVIYLNKSVRLETNVSRTNEHLNNKNSELIVKGFAVYATKSCSFRTSDPPYPPASFCASNSGYIILSDKQVSDKKLNPTNEKTLLDDSEVLIFSVKDSVIDSIKVGDYYQIKGKVNAYNGVPALEYVSLLSY